MIRAVGAGGRARRGTLPPNSNHVESPIKEDVDGHHGKGIDAPRYARDRCCLFDRLGSLSADLRSNPTLSRICLIEAASD